MEAGVADCKARKLPGRFVGVRAPVDEGLEEVVPRDGRVEEVAVPVVLWMTRVSRWH